MAVKTVGDQETARTKADADNTGNTYSIGSVTQDKEGYTVNGTTAKNKYVTVTEDSRNTNTGQHELGHTLNMDHTEEGVMAPVSSDSNVSNEVTQENIDQMIENATVKEEYNSFWDSLKTLFQ